MLDGIDAHSRPSGGMEGLVAAIRRMAAIAQTAVDSETVVRSLAAELLSYPGADEVHVYTLSEAGDGREHVDVYLYGADARLSYIFDLEDRPPGVEVAARSGEPVIASGRSEVESRMPRLRLTGEADHALMVPMIERGESAAVVVLVRASGEPFSAADADYCAAIVEQASTALALCAARAEAGTDPVTGAMNRRAMHRRLEEEIGRAGRTGGPLSCLLIDLDNFKRVNDVHGHPAGDALLRSVVQVLIGEFRSFDRVARYGGDEFAVILPNADLKSAAAAAGRALERLEEVGRFGDTGTGVGASIGAAQWRSGMDVEMLLAACDDALLRSKREGKGRVTSEQTATL